MEKEIIPHVSLGNPSKQLPLSLKTAGLDAIIENSCQMELAYEYISTTPCSVESILRLFTDCGWPISTFIFQLGNQAYQSKVIQPKPIEKSGSAR